MYRYSNLSQFMIFAKVLFSGVLKKFFWATKERYSLEVFFHCCMVSLIQTMF